MEEISKFNLESRFIEHANPKHEEFLEKKEFDYEYQEEFKDFFVDVFGQVGIDAATSLYDSFNLPPKIQKLTDKRRYSGYIKATTYLDVALNSRHAGQRLLLDQKLSELLGRDIARLPVVEQDRIVTEGFSKKVNLEKLISIMENEQDQAKKNLLLLIIQIVKPDAISKNENEVAVNEAETSLMAGTCEKAEKHMLAYISGQHINPEGGYVNLILNNDRSPLMLEKVSITQDTDDGLGDSHSCISLKPIRLGRVLIPAGAIFYADQDGNMPLRAKMNWFNKDRDEKKEGAINYVTNLTDYKGFKFLRMSILSLPEEIRASAGGHFYLYQQNRTRGYINYDWITPEIIAEYAELRLKQEGM